MASRCPTSVELVERTQAVEQLLVDFARDVAGRSAARTVISEEVPTLSASIVQ
jgi:hypothetical protein